MGGVHPRQPSGIQPDAVPPPLQAERGGRPVLAVNGPQRHVRGRREAVPGLRGRHARIHRHGDRRGGAGPDLRGLPAGERLRIRAVRAQPEDRGLRVRHHRMPQVAGRGAQDMGAGQPQGGGGEDGQVRALAEQDDGGPGQPLRSGGHPGQAPPPPAHENIRGKSHFA